MGIKNLKYLFQNVKCVEPPTTFNSMVVDGNNLIITSLCSAKSKIEKQYPLVDWQGFSIDIVLQTKLILLESYKLILSELSRFQEHYQLKEIWIVFDPTKNMHYDIDINTFDLVDREFFTANTTNSVISLNLKEEEHKKREQSRNITKDKMNNTISSITNSDYYTKLADSDLLTAIYKQSYGYNDSTLLHKLLRMLQKALIAKSRFNLHLNFIEEREDFINLNTNINLNCKLYTVKAKDEADLIIKNICNDINIINNNRYNILVMSKDTDYKVLFADTPTVYITGLHYEYNNILFHPYSAWRSILPSSITDNIYEYVIRLAPIFGNDYTCGKSLITLSETNDSISQLNSLLQLDANNLNKRSTLYKFITSTNRTKGILTPTDLDNRIKEFDPTNYYPKYLKSVVIYTNYIQYHNFEISTKYFDFEENLNFIYNNIIKPTFNTIYYFKPSADLKQLFADSTIITDFNKEFYKDILPTNEIDDSYFD